MIRCFELALQKKNEEKVEMIKCFELALYQSH